MESARREGGLFEAASGLFLTENQLFFRSIHPDRSFLSLHSFQVPCFPSTPDSLPACFLLREEQASKRWQLNRTKHDTVRQGQGLIAVVKYMLSFFLKLWCLYCPWLLGPILSLLWLFLFTTYCQAMLFSLNNFIDALDKVKLYPFIFSASNRLCLFFCFGYAYHH